MEIRPGSVLLLVFGFFLHGTCGQCIDATHHIGVVSPMDVPVVGEGGHVSLNCSLNASYAASHAVTSQHIVWQLWDGLTSRNLTPAKDSRVILANIDGLTQTFRLENASQADSASYRCAVVDGDKSLPVCAVEVTVAGPPMKYKNFGCVSENYASLKCWWERGDKYPQRAATKYSLTYNHNLTKGQAEKPCPRPYPEDTTRTSSRYECLWKSMAVPGAVGELPKMPAKLEMMTEYVYHLTIHGTNDLGRASWTETVRPADYVRPAAPTGVKVSQQDARSCTLTWDSPLLVFTSDMVRQIGLLFHVEYRRSGGPGDSVEWLAYDENVIEDPSVVLDDLVANSQYEIRVSSYPNTSKHGLRSEAAVLTCNTSARTPEGEPGVVEGAYEEVGNGLQRQVTLYWKGVPEYLQNGPNFLYSVYLIPAGTNEPQFLTSTEFANQVIPAPSTKALKVQILAKNGIGNGEMEEVIIPAARDQPLTIRFANVVKFNATLYEVSWGTNRPARLFDIYWCPTSLSTHLAKCTKSMNHVLVDGHKESVNVTVDGQHEYRFAVSARGDLPGEYSGMTWKGRHCSVTDREPWLDTLKVEALANSSVKVMWNVPCQHRFRAARRYRLDFYPCREDTPTECVQDRFATVENASEHVIANLLPERRYCFEVSVMDNASVETTTGSGAVDLGHHVISKCLITSPLAQALPKGVIAGGVIGGGLLLFILVLLAWCGIKRVRKDVREIQKQSRDIKIPSPSVGRYADDYNKDDSHYTKIDLDDQHPYARQFSDGIGSMESTEAEKDLAAALLPNSEPHSTTERSPSSHDLIMASQDEADPQGAGFARLSDGRLSFRARPLGSADKLQVLPPTRQNCTQLTGGNSQSGQSGVSQSSSGYVPAASFESASDGSSHGQSSGAVSGDTGYTSHPSVSSSESAHTGVSDDSGASSGFAESESPEQRRKSEAQPLLWKNSLDPSLDSLDGADDPFPAHPGPLGLTQAPRDPLPTKYPQEVTAGTGYVAWP